MLLEWDFHGIRYTHIYIYIICIYNICIYIYMLCIKWRNGNREKKTFCRFMNRRYCFYHFCVDIFPLWTQGLPEKGLNLTSTLITQILQKVPEGKMMLFEVCVLQYIFIRTPKLKLSQTILCIYIYTYIQSLAILVLVW